MSIATEFEYRCSVDSDIVGHLPYLFERASRAQTILELGVRSGNSTAAFLAGIEAGDGHLTSVDILAPQVPAEWFEHHRWTFILGSDLDEFVEAGTPDEVDLLFIDTTHTFRQTQAELDLYGGRVRSGGERVVPAQVPELRRAPRLVRAWRDRGGVTNRGHPRRGGLLPGTTPALHELGPSVILQRRPGEV